MRLRYYCHAGLETGFGRAALDYALALARHGGVELDLRLLPSTSELPERGAELAKCMNAGGQPDVVLVHTLPRDCYRVVQIEKLEDVPNVAYTTWEALSFPEQLGWPLFEFDVVATPSWRSAEPIRERFASFFETDERAADHGRTFEMNCVKVIPHTFDPAHLQPVEREMLGDPADRYTFYYVGAWNRRKNVDGLLRAFAHAFGADDRVHLHLHCAGASRIAFLGAMAMTGLELRNVTFKETRDPEYLMVESHRYGDSFVTATRGEAWNLPAFEALVAGRHVIAPAHMGHEDFLARTSADLIDATPTPASMDVTMEEQDGRVSAKVSGPTGLSSMVEWLEPDLIALSHAMQAARARQARTIETEYDVARRFSYEAVAPQLIAALEEARNA